MKLVDRIQRVTDDIREIEQELEEAARAGCSSRHADIFDEQETVALLGGFKIALDNLRRFLWAYIDTVAINRDGMTEALQSARLRRVAELLRVLRESETNEAASDRGISAVVDSVMAVHQR